MQNAKHQYINDLEKDDQSTWEAMRSWDFEVAKWVLFTHLFTDQVPNEEVECLKQYGGIVGLTQDAAVLYRLVTTTPHLAHIVNEYLKSVP